MRVTVATAKNSLTRLLRLAEDGETIIIERHGKPVAQLIQLPHELRAPKPDPFVAAINEVVCPAYLKNLLRS